jgi:hypothetical protein
MRHIHVHLHAHGSSPETTDQATPRGLPKPPSTTPKRPPSTLIKPSPQAPHKAPSPNKAEVKPMKPAGVIKPQQGTGAKIPGIKVATHTVRGAAKLLGVANRIAAEG